MDIRTVRMERDIDGSFIVSDDLTVVYGHGQTLIEAKQDYVANLLEYAPSKLDANIESCATSLERLREVAEQLGEEIAAHMKLNSRLTRLADWLMRMLQFVKKRFG